VAEASNFSPKQLEWPRGPPHFLFNEYWAVYLGVKWLKCEAPYIAEVNNMWSYTCTPPYAFVMCIGPTLP